MGNTVIKHDFYDRKGKFTLHCQGDYAGHIDYHCTENNSITITHTVVPKEFGGRGFAKKLMAFAVDYAEQNALTIVPECSFAIKYLDNLK